MHTLLEVERENGCVQSKLRFWALDVAALFCMRPV
jgi:hypothetical protein